MANSAAFDRVCEQLERDTSLDRLEARGTVRLALKQAGLDPGMVTPDQMRVVVERVLPGELTARGVADPEGSCRALASGVAEIDAAGSADTPDAVFARLAGGASA